MIKYTFQCDRCKGEWPIVNGNPEGVQQVNLCLTLNFGQPYKGTSPEINQTWCRECVIKEGVFPPRADKDKAIAPTPAPTVEERLCLLLRELGFVTRDEVPS